MNIFSPCFRINLMILPDQQFHNTAISQVKRKRVCVCVCVWIAFITMQFCIGIPIIPYTTSWSDFEEVLSILLTSTDDEQCKSFPCCLDLVAFVDRKCSWLILWFWRLDQISSKLPFLQCLDRYQEVADSKTWGIPGITQDSPILSTCVTLWLHINSMSSEEMVERNSLMVTLQHYPGVPWPSGKDSKLVNSSR